MKRPRISIPFVLLVVPHARSYVGHILHRARRTSNIASTTETHPARTNDLETFISSRSTLPLSDSVVKGERLEGSELVSLDPDELARVLGGSGRARMVWDALAAGYDPFSHEGSSKFITPKTAETLANSVEQLPWQVIEESVSNCGTRKLLIRLEDALEVETVVIPGLTGARSTVCVSSQVGCVRNCQFCMTGKMGMVRNLTAGEILAQVFFARQTARQHGMPPLTNVVFMGMGEPLDNPSAVSHSLEVMTHPHAFAIAKGKISVSTVGPSPAAIRRMEAMPARLAWSVHAAMDDVRKSLVPTTAHSMEELRDAFSEVLQRRGREHLFVEVVLIRGVNDMPRMAHALACLLRPLATRASINLLPFNDTGHPTFLASTPEAVLAFQRILAEEGFVATIRRARGDETSSACGQLATSARSKSRSKSRRWRGEENYPVLAPELGHTTAVVTL